MKTSIDGGISVYLPVLMTSICSLGFPGGVNGKEPTCHCRRQEMWFGSLGREDPLEEGTGPHFRILVWRIPWTEEPGGLLSARSHRHD